MKKVKRSWLAILIIPLLPLSMMVISIPAEATTWYEVTNSPRALEVSSGEPSWIRGYPGPYQPIPYDYNACAYLYSHETVVLGSSNDDTMQWVSTGQFRGSSPTEGGNYSEYPDDSATIVSVFVVSRWQSAGYGSTPSPESVMGVSINNGSTWTWSSVYPANATSGIKTLIWNVTGLATWTPELVQSFSLYVKIYSYMVKDVFSELDYLGLYYYWSSPVQPPSQGGSTGDSGGSGFSISFMPNVTGIMGIFGFIGMIAIPAASVWLFKRDGGSKIYAGVMALVAFTVCFGLFYASINGG